MIVKNKASIMDDNRILWAKDTCQANKVVELYTNGKSYGKEKKKT